MAHVVEAMDNKRRSLRSTDSQPKPTMSGLKRKADASAASNKKPDITPEKPHTTPEKSTQLGQAETIEGLRSNRIGEG